MPTSPYPRTGAIVPLGSEPDQVPADLKRVTDQYENRMAVYSANSGAPTGAGVIGEFRFDTSRRAAVWVGTGTGWAAMPVMPIGGLLMWPGTGAPGDGVSWLPCNGASLVRIDYPDLFAAIGTSWGAPSGSTFSLPDLQTETIVGAGSKAGRTSRTVGQTGGEENHTLSSAEVPDHVHPIPETTGDGPFGGAAPTNAIWSTHNGVPSGNNLVTAGAGFGGGPHNNMQPYAVVRMLIRAL